MVDGGENGNLLGVHILSSFLVVAKVDASYETSTCWTGFSTGRLEDPWESTASVEDVVTVAADNLLSFFEWHDTDTT